MTISTNKQQELIALIYLGEYVVNAGRKEKLQGFESVRDEALTALGRENADGLFETYQEFIDSFDERELPHTLARLFAEEKNPLYSDEYLLAESAYEDALERNGVSILL